MKGILSIIEKMRLVFIASNTMATLPARVLIADSAHHLRGLFTWSCCLSLLLRCKARGKPRGLRGVRRAVSARARTRPINISLSSYLIETSPVLNHRALDGPSSFVMLHPLLSSMNMDGLFTALLLKLLLCTLKKLYIEQVNKKK